jgi:diguanylate cyclase (GGDEF)-like protein
MTPLQLSAVSELRELAQLIHHRLLQLNRLSSKLRQANANLRGSRATLRDLLRTDPLTGCGNRKALDERLAEEILRCARSHEAISALVLRVDDIERINREFGHRAGDALLQGHARVLHRRLRRTDKVYRPTGDCFMVLAIGCGPDDAGRLAEALRSAMGEVYMTAAVTGEEELAAGEADQLQVRSRVSVGVSSLNPSADTPEGLVQRSLEALTSAAPAAP